MTCGAIRKPFVAGLLYSDRGRAPDGEATGRRVSLALCQRSRAGQSKGPCFPRKQREAGASLRGGDGGIWTHYGGPAGSSVASKSPVNSALLPPLTHRRARMLTGTPSPRCTTGSHSRAGAARAGFRRCCGKNCQGSHCARAGLICGLSASAILRCGRYCQVATGKPPGNGARVGQHDYRVDPLYKRGCRLPKFDATQHARKHALISAR